MNTQIQIFSNPEFGEIRTLQDESGNPIFCLKDVAEALGYVRPADAISAHCKGVGNLPTPSTGGIQMMKWGGEANVYRLVMKSKLPTAERFQDWVVEEVLPSIRKTGGYIATSENDTPELIMARAVLVAQEAIEKQKQQIQMLEGERDHYQGQVLKLAPKAEYTDHVLQSTSTYTFTQLAKELNYRSVAALLADLTSAGIIFKQSGQWMPRAKYSGQGYTATRTHRFFHKDGTPDTTISTVWTERGRQFLHTQFNS